jgi:hypothetical protein
MKFKLDIFDAPPKPQSQLEDVEKTSVDSEPEIKTTDPRKIIQVCKKCKIETPLSVEDWSAWWGAPPETDQEKVSRLLRYLKLYVEQDRRVRFMPMHTIIHGMLSVDGTDGEAMFNAMDESTKAYFTKLAKCAFDTIVGEYLDIRDLIQSLDKYGVPHNKSKKDS